MGFLLAFKWFTAPSPGPRAAQRHSAAPSGSDDIDHEARGCGGAWPDSSKLVHANAKDQVGATCQQRVGSERMERKLAVLPLRTLPSKEANLGRNVQAEMALRPKFRVLLCLCNQNRSDHLSRVPVGLLGQQHVRDDSTLRGTASDYLYTKQRLLNIFKSLLSLQQTNHSIHAKIKLEIE